jgi:hypothetical protein
MMGVAAAEIGIKQSIAALAPDAAWLVVEAPTPPIHKILKSYLPRIADCSAMPNGLHNKIQKAVEARNDLVHKGEYAMDYSGLTKHLANVRKCLWWLDYLQGADWALSRAQDPLKPWNSD